MTEITIPDQVTTIESTAFHGCQNVTKITIGKRIQKIGYGAFGGIPELTDFYCLAEKVPETNVDAFASSYIEYAMLHVPEAAVEAYKAVEPWNRFKNFYDSTGITTISKLNGQATIHDLRGIQLKRIPDKGIYIQNGRKRVSGHQGNRMLGTSL